MPDEKGVPWPHENEIFIDPLNPNPDFYSISCMGKTLTFFVPSNYKKGENGLVRDTYWFLAGMEEI